MNAPQKFDSEKLRFELIPPELLEAAARGLTYGAKKYSAGNWAIGSGFAWSRLFGALMRHLWAFWRGQDVDPESGCYHLDHAACMLAFLIAHAHRRHGWDDRVGVGAAHDPQLAARDAADEDGSAPPNVPESKPCATRSPSEIAKHFAPILNGWTDR